MMTGKSDIIFEMIDFLTAKPYSHEPDHDVSDVVKHAFDTRNEDWLEVLLEPNVLDLLRAYRPQPVGIMNAPNELPLAIEKEQEY